MAQRLRLTKKQKRKYLPFLIRHYGHVCYYCKGLFESRPMKIDGMTNPYEREYDHLNDIEDDNMIENVVEAHKICNQRKKNQDKYPEMKKMAMKQLAMNYQTGIAGYIDSVTDPDNEFFAEKNPEIPRADITFQDTSDYLNQKTKDGQRIPYNATANNIAMILQKKYGFGSQKTVKEKIAMLTSDEGEFYKYREGTKWWLSRTPDFIGR